MYNKEEVIRRIGEENWEAFEFFMTGALSEYDENGEELYYEGDISEFERQL